MTTTTAGVAFAKVSYAPAGSRSGNAAPSVLQDVSLRLAAGTTTALLGRSGAGKTTLLRMVNGLVRPSSGEVRVGGAVVRSAEYAGAYGRSIGYVIQEAGLFPHMTVERNAGLALELAGAPEDRRSPSGWRRCWGWWVWGLPSFGLGIRGSFRVDSGSGWGWRGRWRPIPRCC